MQLKDLWGSAWGRASEMTASVREKAQERLVVIGARDSGLSVKWGVVIALALMLLGGYFGYRIGGIQYREFVLRQDALLEEVRAKNRMLIGELEVARKQLNDQEARQRASDKQFDDKLSRLPVSDKCAVPVDGLNVVVREANQ